MPHNRSSPPKDAATVVWARPPHGWYTLAIPHATRGDGRTHQTGRPFPHVGPRVTCRPGRNGLRRPLGTVSGPEGLEDQMQPHAHLWAHVMNRGGNMGHPWGRAAGSFMGKREEKQASKQATWGGSGQRRGRCHTTVLGCECMWKGLV